MKNMNQNFLSSHNLKIQGIVAAGRNNFTQRAPSRTKFRIYTDRDASKITVNSDIALVVVD
jgi:hypothetical protein